jgi:hypothetical protein
MSDIARATVATSRAVGDRWDGPLEPPPHPVAIRHETTAATAAARVRGRGQCTNCCNVLISMIRSTLVSRVSSEREEHRRHASSDTLETDAVTAGTLTNMSAGHVNM